MKLAAFFAELRTKVLALFAGVAHTAGTAGASHRTVPSAPDAIVSGPPGVANSPAFAGPAGLVGFVPDMLTGPPSSSTMTDAGELTPRAVEGVPLPVSPNLHPAPVLWDGEPGFTPGRS